MKLGFIGCGNMAGAMIGGILKNGILPAEEMIGSNSKESSLKRTAQEYGIQTTLDNRAVAGSSDILVLSVKPQYYAEVIEEIRQDVREDQLIVTIAPGKTIEWLTERFAKPVKIIRCMPNTPALVGEGITGVCAGSLVSREELDYVCHILSGCGRTEVVSEKLLDVVVSVSGSAPAYVFMFIEAMADGAVADGMPRVQAYKFAAQAVLGSAKMVLETGKHPGELKDMVCSPGGTTIEAVRVLEEKGLRSAVIEAMKACVEKGRNM
ncbi:pyrroline-5-carboxylate reductase [Murimonas intestini]|uniref:pyrroline-5-carboxylate reductase n=1 Tax=Murimonas intestini TaxID=1337051 RepID=UPI0011DCF498|nr:pyrroline-5-carboxylate reductase [Murimonas intestini]